MGFIEFLKYVLLGIVQGFTEILPVSSTGHVELFKVLLGVDIDADLLFQIVVNTGSLVAFLVIFAKDLFRLTVSFFTYAFVPSRREAHRDGFLYVLKLVVASIPAALVGFTLKNLIDDALGTYGTLFSGIGLLGTATILLLTSKHKIRRGNTGFSFLDAALIGAAQAVALIPGLSRSGATTSAAIRRGIGLETALRFSFIMYIPASIGSLVVTILDYAEAGTAAPSAIVLTSYLVAFAAATVATFIAYKLIFNAFRSGRLKIFSVYCFFAGVLSVLLYIAR